MNIEDNISKERSLSPSDNRQRTMFVNSYMSFIDYTEWVQAQSDKLSWAEQLKMREYYKLYSACIFTTSGLIFTN